MKGKLITILGVVLPLLSCGNGKKDEVNNFNFRFLYT